MSNAGKGDAPRPVNMAAYTAHYDEIFRKGKSSTPSDEDDPFESKDHDNDDDTYAERIGYP